MGQEYHQAWWGTWWPWAEANQGLLSVLALVFALALALIENRRANLAEARARELSARADRRAIRQHVIAACRLAEMLKERIEDCRLRVDHWSPDQQGDDLMIWNSGRDTAEALRVLAGAAPRIPELIIATLGAARIADMAANLRGQILSANGWRAWYDTIERGLDRESETLQELSPPPERA